MLLPKKIKNNTQTKFPFLCTFHLFILLIGSLQIILLQSPYEIIRASHMAPVVKNLPAKARDIRDTGSIPELGRSPGRGHGNPFQNSCLENPMDRGAWQGYSPWGRKESDRTEHALAVHCDIAELYFSHCFIEKT